MRRVLQQRTYHGLDAPLVEVLTTGEHDTHGWRPRTLWAWTQYEDGWEAQVAWSASPGETYVDRFPADRVRPVEDDRSRTPDEGSSTA